MNFNKFQFAGKPQAPVLAEKGEVFKTSDGDIQQIASHAPSHDDGEQINSFGIKPTAKGNGGVVVDADSVLSDSYSQVSTGNRKNSMKEQIVKIKAEEGEIIASQLGLDIRLKKSVSPSKLFLEIQEAKDKIALKIMKASEKTQKTRESSNALEANQAQLMSLPTDEEIYEAVFHTQEEKKESSGIDFEATENSQYGGAHYNKNLNYILPNSLLDEKNEDVEEPVFKLKKKEIKGDKRNGYSAYEQNGEIYMDNINDEPIKQHETFHYLRSKGYFSPREQAIENELLDGSIYSPLDKNKLNSDIYSPEELAARFHSISSYLPNNYKEEDFKKLWETGKDLQIQDLKQVIPYDKALYYMNNYHPSKMQMGGMVSKDSSNLKEIKKQRDWLRAWYGERDIVTEPIEIFENELKSVNGSKTKDPEILKQNEEFREWGKKTNFDVSAYYHTPSDRSVFLKDVTGTTDPIHEFTHSIDNNYGDNIGTFNSINPFHPLKTDYTKLGVKPIKENDYFTNTEETYARLNEARYSSGYAANYKPTLEDIKEQRRLNKKNKPKAYNHLFDYYDDNSIMQMWNGLSDTRFEESSVENPMLQSTAKYGIKKQFGGSTYVNREQKIPFIKPSAPVMRKNLMNSLGVRNVSTSYYPEMEKDVQDMISMKNEDLYNKEERKRMREQVLNDLSAQNTIYELAGKPNIGFFNDGSASLFGKATQKILGKNRANYDVLTNTMNVRRGKESDFFAEIAHAIPGNVNTLSDNVRRPFSDIYEDGYSFEYGTHKIVEPELRKTYNWIASGGDKTNNEELKKFAVKKQFGGSSSILKQLQLL